MCKSRLGRGDSLDCCLMLLDCYIIFRLINGLVLIANCCPLLFITAAITTTTTSMMASNSDHKSRDHNKNNHDCSYIGALLAPSWASTTNIEAGSRTWRLTITAWQKRRCERSGHYSLRRHLARSSANLGVYMENSSRQSLKHPVLVVEKLA